MIWPILALLLLSLAANAFLFMRLRHKPKRGESLELREFLGDLLSGPAIVAIARVDQDNLLLRSPKRQ